MTAEAKRRIEIAPSILPADFARLGEELQNLEKAKADRIHWDVMDGVFVPNLTVGPDVVRSCREQVNTRFEAHLMVEDPDLLAPLYIRAGCELITVHVESTRHLDRTLNAIVDAGADAAVTMNPATPLESIDNVLHLVSMVLVMTVNPGFGGQSYIAAQERKVAKLRREIVDRGLDVDIEVDGGIAPATIEAATRAGANIFVAGSAVFNDPEGIEHAIAHLRSLAESVA
ncbi:MAG: ribulose-phosphate 3-epimerase [Acidimicrobiales bacterium]